MKANRKAKKCVYEKYFFTPYRGMFGYITWCGKSTNQVPPNKCCYFCQGKIVLKGGEKK